MTETLATRSKRRTRHSFGAIRKLPSGRYQASYVGPDGIRRPAPHTFSAKVDADEWLSTQRAAIVKGEWHTNQARRRSTDTFSEYAGHWIATRTGRNGAPLRPRTRAEYERLLTGPLSTFADQPLSSIRSEDVRTWYAGQAETGRRTQTSRAYSLLKSILATATSDGYLDSNPCVIRGAASATTGRRVVPPTPEELEVILSTITPRFRAAVAIAAWGACRFGEVTELRRSDLAIKDDGLVAVSIQRAVTNVPGVGFQVGPPKSEAGVRVVYLPPGITDVVVTHLREHTDSAESALLFPAADGVSHIAQSTFAKHWYPARKAAGRPDLSFHALRHFGATRFAQTGATLKEIQDRLGHSTVTAAMRYQHSAGRNAELESARLSFRSSRKDGTR